MQRPPMGDPGASILRLAGDYLLVGGQRAHTVHTHPGQMNTNEPSNEPRLGISIRSPFRVLIQDCNSPTWNEGHVDGYIPPGSSGLIRRLCCWGVISALCDLSFSMMSEPVARSPEKGIERIGVDQTASARFCAVRRV